MNEEHMNTQGKVLGAVLKMMDSNNPKALEDAQRMLEDDAFWMAHEARIAEDEERKRLHREHQFKESLKRQYNALPSEYKELFDRPKSKIPKDVVSLVRMWEPDQGKGIGIYGQTGSGKTRLLTSIFRRLECSWFFLPSIRLSQIITEIHSKDIFESNKAKEDFESAKKCRVLLLDDLGKEKPTDAFKKELEDTLKSRTTNGRPTHWTSEKSLDELRRFYGQEGNSIARKLDEYSILRQI